MNIKLAEKFKRHSEKIEVDDEGNLFALTYTVAEVADIFSVTKKTVYKWLKFKEEDGRTLIDPVDWFRIPGPGYIRIMESALLKMQNIIPANEIKE